ncbi:MAG: tetratricopeptide repeat protein [Massilibacteroides sp.]|nr:tetratricopeptide repeat protein [Massilibacteroides sp.]
MKKEDLKRLYLNTNNYLYESMLQKALDELVTLVEGTTPEVYGERLAFIRSTYKQLLQYRLKGVRDPMRPKIYNDLRIKAFELNADIYLNEMSNEFSTSHFFSKRRKHLAPTTRIPTLCEQLINSVSSNLDMSDKRDQITRDLFNHVWLENAFSKESYAALTAILTHEGIPDIVTCPIVSALHFSMEETFDILKMQLLIKLSKSKNEKLKVRALTGLLITLTSYPKILTIYPDLQLRIENLMTEQPKTKELLQNIWLKILIEKDTSKITEKMQKDIIPNLMNSSKNLDNKINLNDLPNEIEKNITNPEWAINDKYAQKMNKLYEEGADMMHSSFSPLKKIPFFNYTINWVMPFNTQLHILKEITKKNEKKKKIFASIEKTPQLCDSDKYTFALVMLNFPDSSKNQFTEQFNESLETFMDIRMENNDSTQITKVYISHYIQDLYRFYTLQNNRSIENNIFDLRFDFNKPHPLEPYLNDIESLSLVGNFNAKNDHYESAAVYYHQLTLLEPNYAAWFEKLGYCVEHAFGDSTSPYPAVLDIYKRAELINPNSRWLTKKLANCCRRRGLIKEALDYYRLLESQSPKNDISNSLNIGYCLMLLKRYDEALNYYFKVEYLDESKQNKAWRPLAWCLFLSGKYEQASNYYKKIIEQDGKTSDYLNAGHTAWVMKDWKLTTQMYFEAYEKCTEENKDFYQLLFADKEILNQNDIKEDELTLMVDMITLMYRNKNA